MHSFESTVAALTAFCLLAGLWKFKDYFLSLRRPEPAAVYGTTASSSSFSLQNAFRSFQAYPATATSEGNSYRSKLNTLRGAHKRLAIEVGYPSKIESFRRASEANTRLTRTICRVAKAEFPEIHTAGPTSAQDIGRVRESLKHLVRDWSAQGKRERDVIFTPILEQLDKIPKDKRATYRVLVPGAGLGRLAWEIASMGTHRKVNLVHCLMSGQVLILHLVNCHTT